MMRLEENAQNVGMRLALLSGCLLEIAITGPVICGGLLPDGEWGKACG